MFSVLPAVWDYSTGRVGAPLVCSEITLKDWEEGESGRLFLRESKTPWMIFCLKEIVQDF